MHFIVVCIRAGTSMYNCVYDIICSKPKVKADSAETDRQADRQTDKMDEMDALRVM